MTYHQKLSDTNEDQLSLAAIHYLRSHFQEVRAAAKTCRKYLPGNGDESELYSTGWRADCFSATNFQ